jgi:hypothetical protein
MQGSRWSSDNWVAGRSPGGLPDSPERGMMGFTTEVRLGVRLGEGMVHAVENTAKMESTIVSLTNTIDTAEGPTRCG